MWPVALPLRFYHLIKEGQFLRAFGQKGRVSSLLERVPVHVVLNPQVGLIGAAICASRL
jgi:glucokinase